MREYIGRILLAEDAILRRVRELGQQISNDYRGKEITIVCVLKGAIVFLADLLRSLDVPTGLDFVQISSYGDGTKSSGKVEFLQCLTTDIEGRDVLIVDDIVDSGLTLHCLRKALLAKRPASLKLCVLLDKDKSRNEDMKIDYAGFEIPDKFVIGYGLDYAGQYRGLRYIATLEL
jgi:hypoxanthine phosphoribosyltransferase